MAGIGLTTMWQVGDTIADLYEVRGINTEGGMSIVYFVWHKAWRMELVIKSPRPEVLADGTARARFLQEAETWVDLGLHPNVVTAYYVREIESFPRMVIEKMDGGSLKAWLRARRAVDLATALDVAVQIALGLAYAERRRPGFVHRDVKPANVLLTPDGEAKVTDFGLVGAVGARVGTPAYMAPEVWAAPDRVTRSADAYAFGVLLYELLAGRRPFERGESGTSLGQIQGGRAAEGSLGALRGPRVDGPRDQSLVSLGEQLDIQALHDRSVGAWTSTRERPDVSGEDLEYYERAHRDGVPDPPDRFNPGLPDRLNRLCMSLLAKDAGERPARMEDIAEELRQAYAAATGHAYPREDPEDSRLQADSLNNRALSYLDLGRPELAEAALGEALAASPSHAEAEYNLAMLHWQSGETTDLEVVARIENVGRNAPAAWRAPYLLGLAHIARRDAEAARAALGVAAERSAGEPDVEEALAELAGDTSGWARRLGEPRWVPDGPFGYVSGAALAHDAPIAVAAFEEEVSGALKVWNLEEPRPLRVMRGHPGAPASVAISADGRRAISGGRDPAHLLLPGRTPPGDRSVRVWDVTTGSTSAVLSGHTGYVEAVVLTRDGRVGASSGGDRTILVWDIDRSELRCRLLGHDSAVRALAVSGDGSRLVSGGDDATVRLWDTGSGACLAVLPGHGAAVRGVAISEKKDRALSGGLDGTVRLWDLERCECLRVVPAGARSVSGVGFLGDGSCAFSCGTDRDLSALRLWHLDSGDCIRSFGGKPDVAGTLAAVSGDGVILSAGSRRITFWHPGRLEPPARRFVLSRVTRSAVQLAHARTVSRLTETARGHMQTSRWRDATSFIREARGIPGYERHPELLDLWHALSLKGRRTGLRAWWEAAATTFPKPVRSLAVSDDGRVAASGHVDGELRVWSRDGRCLHLLEGQRFHSDVLAVAISRDGRFVVSAGAARSIHCWQVETGACTRVFDGHRREVRSLALAEDGRHVWSASLSEERAASVSLGGSHLGQAGERTVRLWDVESGACVRTIDLDFLQAGSPLERLALLADGRRALATSKDRSQRLWDIGSGAVVELGSDLQPGVAALSASGRRLLVAVGRTVRLLEIPSGAVVREVTVERERVEAIAFLSDERFALVSGTTTMMGAHFSQVGDLSLWDFDAGTCLGALTGHKGPVPLVSVARDGRFAVSAGGDSTLRFWELDWEFEPASA